LETSSKTPRGKGSVTEIRQRLMPEPWRVKVVEPIQMPDRRTRDKYLKKAGYNLFAIPSEAVFIDLLTDSGTSAMSDEQWAAMMRGDESHAGSRNFYSFETTVREIFGFPHVIPTHLGRVAENLLFSTIVRPGSIVPSNTHFDTTRANIEANGGTAVDLGIPEGRDLHVYHPFKGNMDVARLSETLQKNIGRVPLVMLTMTNTSGGGQPVSLENVRAVKEVCEKYEVPLIIDACRFAENAFFIREREESCRNWSMISIVREVFTFADGCTMSAKKDGLSNIGGFLALRHDTWIQNLKNKLILIEGFPTYGGMAGRDLEVVARGLREVLDERYLSFRIAQVRRLGDRLRKAGVPIVEPVGGHAVYLDARSFLPHIAPEAFPAQALVIALYTEGAVRTAEIGGVMFGKIDPKTGVEALPELDLVRLTVPRRVYTNTHLDYVAEIVIQCHKQREAILGVKITKQAPFLRHFTAEFEPLTD
jgi:tyrosine phenol-lyase